MDFRKAFFPTKEESARQKELLMELEQEYINFWKDKGFTEDEIKRIDDLERKDLSELKPYEYIVSRKALLESNIISVEQIKEEIK